jgi:hypothetical protein
MPQEIVLYLSHVTHLGAHSDKNATHRSSYFTEVVIKLHHQGFPAWGGWPELPIGCPCRSRNFPESFIHRIQV